jgi:hypothetical protein
LLEIFQLCSCVKKGCQIFVAHMEEVAKDKVANIEDHSVLKDFEEFFREILGLPPKRDIDFYIDLVSGVSLVSKTPYRMGTPELKELHMQLEEMLNNGYILKVCHLGQPKFFF